MKIWCDDMVGKLNRIIFFAIILVAVIYFTSCTKEYTEDDIKEYIRNELNIYSFDIIGDPEEVEGDDGYRDYMWTVKTDQFNLLNDLVFHVYDDYHWGMESVTNSLDDDLNYQKQIVLLQEYTFPEEVLVEESKNESGRTSSFMIISELQKREDFEKEIILIEEYLNHVQTFPSIDDTEMIFGFRIKQTESIPDSVLYGWNYTFYINGLMTRAEIREKIKEQSDKYLKNCIEKGILDRMDEYTIAERSAVIKESGGNTEIKRIGENTAAYPGYAYEYYYSIPYGTYYRILEVEGYHPEGDWKSFSFAGIDGNNYSYSYVEGGPVSVPIEEINASTSLNIDDGTPLVDKVIDKNLLMLLEMDADEFVRVMQSSYVDCYRSIESVDGTVYMKGKKRQFNKIIKQNEQRLNELDDILEYYYGGYGFSYNNMYRVYQGIDIRLGSDVPKETLKEVVNKAVALAAMNQVLCKDEEEGWNLEVSFSVWYKGDTEKILIYDLPGDTIDYERVYNIIDKYQFVEADENV